MASSLANCSSSSESDAPLPKPKRQRIVLNLLDSDDESSGDSILFAEPRKSSTPRTAPRAKSTRAANPRVTLSSERPKLSEKDDDNDDDDASASTMELARRIRGSPFSATTTNQKEQPRAAEQTALAGKPSTQSNASPSDIIRNNPSRNLKDNTPSWYNQNKEKELNKPSSLLEIPSSLKMLTVNHSPTDKDSYETSDDDDDNNSDIEKNDDASSVSTMELARRIRGENPRAATVKQTPLPSTENRRAEMTVTAAQSFTGNDSRTTRPSGPLTEVYTEAEDFYLPSPLPSSDDSSVDQDEPNDSSDIAGPDLGACEQEFDETQCGPNNFPDDDSIEIVVDRQGTARQNAPAPAAVQPIVREGLRSPPGPWARQRQLNSTGALFANQQSSWSRATRRQSLPSKELEEDIEAFSDEDQTAEPPSTSAQSASARGRVRRSNVRHVSDPSFAANVVGGFSRTARSSTSGFNGDFTQITGPPRNDLTGGSGVGAGQYQMFAQPPPEPTSRQSRGGRGRKRSGGGGGGGRGRRRGSSRGRVRGRGYRGRGGRGGRRTDFQQAGNAWSDYTAQSASWASNSQPSNLGNVGGAEISF